MSFFQARRRSKVSTTYMQFNVWFAFLSLAVTADIAADERAVLVELYTATNGPTTWSAGCRNGWSGALPHCSGAWFGVGCDVAGRVTSIALTTCGMTGTVPPSLGNLSMLQVVRFLDNQISGTLPPELGRLELLNTLTLSNNRFVGTLPSEWSGWTIEYLNLSNNRLSGSLPREWGRLRGVRELLLDGNFFVGRVPHQWSTIFPSIGIVVSSNCLRYASGWYTVANSKVTFLPQRRTSECRTLSSSRSVLKSLSRTRTRDTNLSWSSSSSTTTTGYTVALARNPPPVSSATLTPHHQETPQHHTVSTFTSVFVAVVVPLTTAGTSTATLSASLAAVRIAARIARLNEDIFVSSRPSTVGSLVADHPLRFRLAVSVGDDRQTWAGAVVGNWCVVALLCPAALGCASYVHGRWLSGDVPATTAPTRRSCLRAGVGGSLAVWGALQVPTTAAAVALLADGGSGSATAVAGLAGHDAVPRVVGGCDGQHWRSAAGRRLRA